MQRSWLGVSTVTHGGAPTRNIDVSLQVAVETFLQKYPTKPITWRFYVSPLLYNSMLTAIIGVRREDTFLDAFISASCAEIINTCIVGRGRVFVFMARSERSFYVDQSFTFILIFSQFGVVNAGWFYFRGIWSDLTPEYIFKIPESRTIFIPMLWVSMEMILA